MNTLNIDTGEQTYSLNGDCEVHFNPSDASFIRKLYDTFSAMAQKQDEYTKKRETIDATKVDELFEFLAEEDKKMREAIDGVFDVPVCDKIFKDKSLYSLTTSGIPLWAGLLLAIIDECHVDIETLNKEGNKTVQKYIKKYHK